MEKAEAIRGPARTDGEDVESKDTSAVLAMIELWAVASTHASRFSEVNKE